MRPSIRIFWITINILLAAAMVYLAITLGVSNKTTLIVIAVCNLSNITFLMVQRGFMKKGALRPDAESRK